MVVSKVLTAIVSCITSVILFKVVPDVLKVPVFLVELKSQLQTAKDDVMEAEGQKADFMGESTVQYVSLRALLCWLC